MRISIVFEEGDWVDEGREFGVFLDGLTPERRREIDAMTPEEQLEKLSTVEFWALRCFQIVADVMTKSGAIRSAVRRS